jgi:hypothetical protein
MAAVLIGGAGLTRFCILTGEFGKLRRTGRSRTSAKRPSRRGRYLNRWAISTEPGRVAAAANDCASEVGALAD